MKSYLKLYSLSGRKLTKFSNVVKTRDITVDVVIFFPVMLSSVIVTHRGTLVVVVLVSAGQRRPCSNILFIINYLI